MNSNLLIPLEHLSYIIECSGLGYTGELKTELAKLCQNIRNGSDGYERAEHKMTLPELEKSLDCYRDSNMSEGAGILSAVSRKWWRLILERYWINFEYQDSELGAD
jgi:hypothetical protein